MLEKIRDYYFQVRNVYVLIFLSLTNRTMRAAPFESFLKAMSIAPFQKTALSVPFKKRTVEKTH